MKGKDASKKQEKSLLVRIVSNPLTVIICDVCTIASAFLPGLDNNVVLKTVIILAIAIAFLATVFYIIFRWFSIKRIKINLQNDYMQKQFKIGELLHPFFHELRNSNNFLDTHDNVSEDTFKDKARILCNQIEKVFTKIWQTKNDVCVCIKLIDVNSISSSDYTKWKTYTFVRSSSTDTKRNLLDEEREPIANNTDFEVIVSNDTRFKGFNCFYSENLDKTKAEFPDRYSKVFINSHPDASYKSALVLPIRIPAKYSAPELKIDISKCAYHILGFLCIDSDETFDDEEHNFKYSIFMNSRHYGSAFADSLYHFFESYLLKQLKKAEESQKNSVKEKEDN